MVRIFITGSTDGLGRAAARVLLDGGHKVVLHARTEDRASAVNDLASAGADVVVGDLRSATETRSVADQVNALGHMDAVIHNAGIYTIQQRGATPEGHATTLAVNTLAPYILTALMERPHRLVFLSSGLHRGGEGSLRDIDWTQRSWDTGRAYAESKLYDTVDLETGARTQSWLAVSEETEAKVSGRYWHHQRQQTPAGEATDPAFQDQLLERLAELTGITLPADAASASN